MYSATVYFFLATRLLQVFAFPAASCPSIATVPGKAVEISATTKTFAVPATRPTTTDIHQQFKAGVITDVTCGSASPVTLFDQNIAELQICGGIGAPITNCPGNQTTTTGISGKAKWTLTAPQGATINVFKGSWEECCNAARATCPGATFTATCLGGVTSGVGFVFALSEV